MTKYRIKLLTWLLMANDNEAWSTIYQCMENVWSSWKFAKESLRLFEDKYRWNNLHVNEFVVPHL